MSEGTGAVQQGWFRQGWARLTQTGVWLGAIIGEFVLSPPVNVRNDNGSTTALRCFAIAFLVGLLGIPVAKYCRRRDLKMWLWAAIVAVLAAGFVWSRYDRLWREHSETFEGRRYVIGDDNHLTRLGKIYREQFSSASAADLLARTAGRPDRVWSAEILDSNSDGLLAAYLGSTVLFAAAIISLLQAIHCSHDSPVQKAEGGRAIGS